MALTRSPDRGRRLADLVDTVRVEGDVILDLRHRFKWTLIGPHRIDGTISTSRNAVVGSAALVGQFFCDVRCLITPGSAFTINQMRN
jgi:hypothetical protein